jgi:hypothetical protein
MYTLKEPKLVAASRKAGLRWDEHLKHVEEEQMPKIRAKALVTSNIIQSVCLVGKGRLKERCGLEPRTNFFFV